jgi:hypothetical protein
VDVCFVVNVRHFPAGAHGFGEVMKKIGAVLDSARGD